MRQLLTTPESFTGWERCVYEVLMGTARLKCTFLISFACYSCKHLLDSMYNLYFIYLYGYLCTPCYVLFSCFACTLSHFLCAAICESGCVHGECTAPENCTCDLGWTGFMCNTGASSSVILPTPFYPSIHC